jgi:hypothetical protein
VTPYVPITVIDDCIRATGFTQVVDPPHPYPAEARCKWLLERITILKETADYCSILHDNPEVEQLTALVRQQRKWIEVQQHTINTMITENMALRDTLNGIRRLTKE